jgi:spoIIIJ-associated protein
VSQGEYAVADPQSDAAADPGAPDTAVDEVAGRSDDSGSSELQEAAGNGAVTGAESGTESGTESGQDAGQVTDPAPASEPVLADLEQEGEIAADYIEGLLDVADLDGDIDMDVEGDRALVSVVGATLDELVGSRGEVLEALQELTRLAVHRQTGARTRIMLDVGGYRRRRRAELAEAGQDAADEVKQTGLPKKLWAMNPFERKVVHDAVAAAGLRSESEGEEPDRRVVVLPAS